MIEIEIKVKRLRELKEVLEWIKTEKIQGTHLNIKIEVGRG